MVGCFGFNGPLRQYFSLYRAVSQREGERRERIDESKNVQTTPTRTYCKRNRPLPYCNQNCRTPRHWKFIANSSSCTTTELSKLLTSCLTTIKNHVIKYCEKVYERSGKNLFWSIKNSCEVLNKLKSRGFRASSLSTYDFSTLYTTLPHNLIKDKLVDLIERTFQREGSLYIACNDRNAFFTSDAVRNYNLWSCQKVVEALTFLLDNIYIRFDSKLYRQIVGIPMGTNCAPLVADLFLFCYERDFMLSLSEENQSGIIEAFNSTSRYLDDLLNIDNNFFDSMVNRIYPSELQLNKANVSDAEASFLDLNLSISDGFVKTKIYDKRDDFDFDIVNFPFLDGDVPRSASYGVYISQLIRFARVSSHVDDFNTRNKVLTAKLLRQGYRYHKLRKAFSKFYRRHFDIVSKYNVGLKTLLLQGLSEPAPVIFIAGRPKAALLFWFFGDFRCGALLFMVIHVIYKYKNK